MNKINDKSAILYLENDADITEAIDLIKKHHSSDIKLVLPNRSIIAKSSINLKLLDSNAKKMNKHITVITSDSNLHKSLARYGISYLSSIHEETQPDINLKNTNFDNIVIHDHSDTQVIEDSSAPNDKETKGQDEAYLRKSKQDKIDSNNLSTNNKKDKSDVNSNSNLVGDKQPKVPNFDLLKSRLNKAMALMAILLLIIIAMIIIPSANIIVYVKATAVKIGTSITLDTNTIKSDLENNILSANYLDKSQYIEEHYKASGKKDIGTKASGSVMVKNCDDTSKHSIGNGVKVLSKGQEFVSTNSVEVPAGVFAGGGSVCKSSAVELKIQAISNGADFNLDKTFFTIDGMPDLIGGIGTTTGGEEKFIEIVSSSDVDNLKNKLREYDKAKIISDLNKKLPSDSVIIPETLVQTVEKEELTAPVGSENKEGTLKLTLKYSVTSVKRLEIEQIIKSNANKKVDAGSKIYDFDFDSMQFNTVKDIGDGQYILGLDTTIWAGPIITRQELSSKLRFKSIKEAQDVLKSNVKEMDSFDIITKPRFWPKLPILANRIRVNASLKK